MAEQQLVVHPDVSGEVRIERLVEAESSGTERLVVDRAELAPGSAHELHRHPYADQSMYVLSGTYVHRTEDGEQVLHPGQVAAIPAGTWHGSRNDGDVPAQVIAIYAGVGSVPEAGYEPYTG